MGIIFSDKKKRCQIKDLLNTPMESLVLSRLQAGRYINERGMNVPYRLDHDELELLQDEWIYYELSGDVYYAYFEKPIAEIRDKLELPVQHINPNNPFDVF